MEWFIRVTIIFLSFTNACALQISVNETKHGHLIESHDQVRFELKINETVLPNGYAPIITTYAILDGNINVNNETGKHNFKTGIIVGQPQSNRTERNHVNVVVHTKENIVAWSHQLVNQGEIISRTLCLQNYHSDSDWLPSSQTISIVITNMLKHRTNYSISVTTKKLDIPLNGLAITNVTSFGSAVWQYHNSDINGNNNNGPMRVRVHLTSDDEHGICSIVVVHDFNCPFVYSESDRFHRGHWQTMLKVAVIDIDVGSNGYENGFYVVINNLEDNSACYDNIATEVRPQSYLLQSQETVKEISVKLVLLNNTTMVMNGTLIVIAILFGSVAFALFLRLICKVHITGKVSANPKKSNQRVKESYSANLENLSRHQSVSILPDSRKSASVLSQPNTNTIDKTDSATRIKTFSFEDHEKILNLRNERYIKPVQTPGTGIIYPLYLRNIKASDYIFIDINKSQDCTSTSINDDDALRPVRVRISSKPIKSVVSKRTHGVGLTLENLANICDPSLFAQNRNMKSYLYSWILYLGGLFYLLPAGQLMFGMQYFQKRGNEDLCYYNFLCRNTFNISFLEDYGHIFSNIGYIFYGIIFIILVDIRRKRRESAMLKKYHGKRVSTEGKVQDIEDIKPIKYVEFINKCGIPEQYGIFYAMGGALIMEGVMSSCYHICPLDYSFQFDTTFMYITIALTFVKVYQFRHPDITPNAYYIFAMIVLLLIFEVLGYYLEGWVFWVLFVLTYLITLLFFLAELYYQGNFISTFSDILSLMGRQKKSSGEDETGIVKKVNVGGTARNIFILTLICLNLCIMVVNVTVFRFGVSNILLYILGVNMFAYIIFYCCTKFYFHRTRKITTESLTWTCILYFVLSFCTFIAAMYFFLVWEKDTTTSPAQSRHKNRECIISFFDYHDIWHFLSAIGLLFLFLFILTLEDNNTDTPWKEIPVF